MREKRCLCARRDYFLPPLICPTLRATCGLPDCRNILPKTDALITTVNELCIIRLEILSVLHIVLAVIAIVKLIRLGTTNLNKILLALLILFIPLIGSILFFCQAQK